MVLILAGRSHAVDGPTGSALRLKTDRQIGSATWMAGEGRATYLVTAYHVIHGALDIQVAAGDGEFVSIMAAARKSSTFFCDPDLDLAAIRCDEELEKVLGGRLGRQPIGPAPVRVAYSGVLAIGNPEVRLRAGGRSEGYNYAASAFVNEYARVKDRLPTIQVAGTPSNPELLMLESLHVTHGFSGGPVVYRPDDGRPYQLVGMVIGGVERKTTSWGIPAHSIISAIKAAESAHRFTAVPTTAWPPQVFVAAAFARAGDFFCEVTDRAPKVDSKGRAILTLDGDRKGQRIGITLRISPPSRQITADLRPQDWLRVDRNAPVVVVEGGIQLIDFQWVVDVNDIPTGEKTLGFAIASEQGDKVEEDDRYRFDIPCLITRDDDWPARQLKRRGIDFDPKSFLRQVEQGNIAEIDLFLRGKMNPETRDDLRKKTALGWASFYGRDRAVATLLRAGADPNGADASRGTPLQDAAMEGHGTVVGLLIDSGARLDPENFTGATAMALAAARGHHAIVERLIDLGAPLGAQACLALDLAANDGRLEVVRVLLGRGVDPDCRNRKGVTPLMAASWRDFPEVVEWLCGAGADPTIKSNEGSTASSLAAKAGNRSIKVYLDKYIGDYFERRYAGAVKRVDALIDGLNARDPDRIRNVCSMARKSDWSGVAEDLVFGFKENPADQIMILRYFPFALRRAGTLGGGVPTLDVPQPGLGEEEQAIALINRLEVIPGGRERITTVRDEAAAGDWSGVAEDLVHGFAANPSEQKLILRYFPTCMRRIGELRGETVSMKDPE